jgi:ABC-type transporter Mla MlaB component
VIAKRPDRLVVDAAGLEFADSSAIALLVRWANLVPTVEIRQPPELLRHVIARMGLSERLRVRP